MIIVENGKLKLDGREIFTKLRHKRMLSPQKLGYTSLKEILNFVHSNAIKSGNKVEDRLAELLVEHGIVYHKHRPRAQKDGSGMLLEEFTIYVPWSDKPIHLELKLADDHDTTKIPGEMLQLKKHSQTGEFSEVGILYLLPHLTRFGPKIKEKGMSVYYGRDFLSKLGINMSEEEFLMHFFPNTVAINRFISKVDDSEITEELARHLKTLNTKRSINSIISLVKVMKFHQRYLKNAGEIINFAEGQLENIRRSSW